MISSTIINIRDLRGETSVAVAEAMTINNQLECLQFRIDRALSLTAPKDLVAEGIKEYHEDLWHKQAWQEWGHNSDDDLCCHEDEDLEYYPF